MGKVSRAVLAAIVININPILVQLGPLAIRWYGLMYVVGIIVGIQVALPYVRTRGITDDQVWTVLGPCIVAGLIGGRLFYVVQQPLGPFLAQPWRIIATWEGGMAFFGAIAGVFLALLYMCWRDKIPFWWMTDGAAIFASVGQAFGRIGNIINGDILGAPTNLPWGRLRRLASPRRTHPFGEGHRKVAAAIASCDYPSGCPRSRKVSWAFPFLPTCRFPTHSMAGRLCLQTEPP